MIRSLLNNRLPIAFINNNVRQFQVTAMCSNSNKAGEMPYVVGHDKSLKQFYIKLVAEDGEEYPERAVLDYDWIRPGFADLYHTEVPNEFRGKGIAQNLAQAAFDHIVAVDGKMRLTCTYLQKYINDNPLPRYQSRVDNNT